MLRLTRKLWLTLVRRMNWIALPFIFKPIWMLGVWLLLRNRVNRPWIGVVISFFLPIWTFLAVLGWIIVDKIRGKSEAKNDLSLNLSINKDE